MNFDLSELQRMLVTTAANFVKKESPVSRMRGLREDPIGYEREMWQRMAELGWLGLMFPEDIGGFGGQFIDTALLLEKLGSTLVPEPYIPSVMLAGMAILRAGSEEQKGRWLTPLMAGETTLALAYAERQSRYQLATITTTARQRGDDYVLSGEKIFVLGGHDADVLVVSARVEDPQQIGLFVIDRRQSQDPDGLSIQAIKTMDGRRAAIVRMDEVHIAADCVLGPPARGRAVLEDVMDLAAAAACAEGLGVAQAVLDMTVDYLKTREQFGAKIGSFQVLQHRAVDMFTAVELCRSMTIYAALEADNADPVVRQGAISAAKVQLAEGGRFVVRQGIQLHGGMGCSDEHDVGLYFKRMQVLGALFGDDAYHVERITQNWLLGAPPPASASTGDGPGHHLGARALLQRR